MNSYSVPEGAGELPDPRIDLAVLAELRVIPGERTPTLLGDLIAIFVADSSAVPGLVRAHLLSGDR